MSGNNRAGPRRAQSCRSHLVAFAPWMMSAFTVAEGELLALIGPNGAGKTTCFNMLMGQLPRTSGAIHFDGKEISGLPTRTIWQMGVGRTFQITATYPSMSVIENVQMALMSFHRRLYTMLPFATMLYRDEAMSLLDLCRYGRAG